MRTSLLYPAAASLLLGVQVLASPVVEILNGTVVGRDLPEFHEEVFLGIPYSETPVRFEHSVGRTAKFDGAFNASDYSNICYGTGTAPVGYNFSEDCLSLNVIRPAGTTNTSALPVVIWIYGGGFWGGSSADTRLNGSYIVEKSVNQGTPVVFVSINYRVLIMGFPSGDEPHNLGIENLGLLDQRLAFAWVQENIAAFGGDPEKVTIMGESAGGTGILQHLVAYGGRDDHLFRAAIVESGSFYDVPCNWNITATREANYQSFLNATGCADIACLKTLDIETLFTQALVYFEDFLPSIDGDFMTKHPVELFNEGKALNVPLLMGVNDDEGTILVPAGSNTTADIEAQLLAANGSSYVIEDSAFTKLFELYPDDPEAGVPMNTGPGLLASGLIDKTSFLIFNDAIEHSVRRWITSTHAAANNTVFSYRFAQVPYQGLMSSGATHGDEITYVFSNTNPNITLPLGPLPKHIALADRMTRSWVGFIAELNPDAGRGTGDFGNERLSWPAYKEGEVGSNMVWMAKGDVVEVDDYRSEGIAFWTEQRTKLCVGLGV